MARKARVEIEGGLYHVITRGNDRRDIFHSADDFAKFLSLLAKLKEQLPFFLYAYCLMSNHLHLLIERRTDKIGRIMHRLLTGYAQYYNRKYNRVGHLLQGRHKSVLCDSEMYMGELVRYIHLNPVKARIVAKPEEYPYCSHREYLGSRPEGIVDVDPVLRLFHARKEVARKEFERFVAAGVGEGHHAKLDIVEDGRILGSEEFVDAAIHRIGETGRVYQPTDGRLTSRSGSVDRDGLIAAVEMVSGVAREDFCGPMKSAKAIAAKELLIVAGRRLGATVNELADIAGLNTSNVSRRFETASSRRCPQPNLYNPVERVIEAYRNFKIADSGA